MTAPPQEVLEAARMQAGMSFDELWLAYFSLGGAAEPEALRSYLNGSQLLPMDYDVIALALNERFSDQGHHHPVPYHDELV